MRVCGSWLLCIAWLSVLSYSSSCCRGWVFEGGVDGWLYPHFLIFQCFIGSCCEIFFGHLGFLALINRSTLLYGYGTLELGLGLAFSFWELLWAKWKDAKRDTQINTTTTFFHNKRTQRATQLTPFSSICESTALRIGKRQNIWLLEREGAVPSLAYSGVERAAN